MYNALAGKSAMQPIITKREAEKILLQKEGKLKVSLDLGISETEAEIRDGILFFAGHSVPIKEFEGLKDKDCYLIEGNALRKLAFFSEDSSLYYKLIPTSDWPTIALSSAPMHRHTHLSPKQDTELKIKEISPVKGKVLDTCCGMGYTAIMVAKDAEEVHTFERDEYVLHIASLNPYSQKLFAGGRITLHRQNVIDGIADFKDAHFDRIVHDPPTFSISPELYCDKFYAELFRVMKRRGILYHYVPAPGKMKGRQFYPKVIRRLKKAGFSEAQYHPVSSGVRAVKA